MIQIHMIQNHSPSNLNRDDLGAPKSCYFGGVLRNRISSQCIKRSIRLSKPFAELLGGIRTRQLARLITERMPDDAAARRKAEEVFKLCGFLPKKEAKAQDDDAESGGADRSKALVYTTRAAVAEMASLFQTGSSRSPQEMAADFAQIITRSVAAPDMALSGRMLEPAKDAKDVWKKLDTTVEAALQAAHAISTHAARPEVDYYVAADDEPGEDAGAGFVDEAMFASACFYKYFSIDFEQLVANLRTANVDAGPLACHTVGAFLRAAAESNPTGKQNSYAAHNKPDGILVEFRDTPVSYANAFAQPVDVSHRDIVGQSVTQLAAYAHDLDVGYGGPEKRLWFSPNLRHSLTVKDGDEENPLDVDCYRCLDELVASVCETLGYDWADVSRVRIESAGA